MDHLPRRRFADAAGDGDHRTVEFFAQAASRLVQGLLRISDLQRPVTGRRPDFFGCDDGAGRAAAECVGHERRAVAVSATQGPEDVARLRFAAVNNRSSQRGIARGAGARSGQPSAAGRHFELVEGELVHLRTCPVKFVDRARLVEPLASRLAIVELE